jgi:hypothetical protein
VGSKQKRAATAVAWGERELGGARVDGTDMGHTLAESYSPVLPQAGSRDPRAHVLRLVKGMKSTMTGLQDELSALPEPDAETRLSLVRQRLMQAQQALEDLTLLSGDTAHGQPKCDGEARGPQRTAPHSGIISLAFDD